MNRLLTKILFTPFLVIWCISCTSEYEKYNTNPYAATDSQKEYDAYNLRAALVAMQGYVIPTDVNLFQFTDCLLGGSFGGYLSDSNSGFVGKNYATYNPEQHWIKVPFNDIIPKVYTNLLQIKNTTKDFVSLAVSDIVKVAALHRITDIYGHIPYSKIGVDGELDAPYDLQKDVYSTMFNELDNAINILTERQSLNFNPNADRVREALQWQRY